jgi:proline iminopeptidase
MADPLSEPHDGGMLPVGDGHHVSWTVRGAPDGKPMVVLHGGPGSGSGTWGLRAFDAQRWRIVQFDQRNCGRSTPSAGDPSVDLSANTTAHLVADIELLRSHLGIERWTVFGGSWGTTLGLAYAETHGERVTEMILVSVGTTSRHEVHWVTRAMGRVFPEAWERFRDGVPADDRNGDLAGAYSRLLHDPNPDMRERAAQAWCDWEDTHVATYAGHTHDERFDDARFRLCFARLVTHYWSNAAFLPDDALIANAERLAGIPGALIHGRLDISGPADIAWQLARAWPDAELVLIDDAGHGTGHLRWRGASGGSPP